VVTAGPAGIRVAALEPVLPDYDGACLANVLAAVAARHTLPPPWLPAPVVGARQVVLLALDGLGWEQLKERAALAPTLTSMAGGPITAVVPSTTATGLTSLTTGAAPAHHGVVGYRVHVGGGVVLNVLRWRTPAGDAAATVPPGSFCEVDPFGGRPVPVVTRAEFERGGFTGVHLRGARFYGWRMPSTLVSHVRALLRAGEPFVYAYYDGVDKVAHEYGLGDAFDAEVEAADALVATLADSLPPGAALVVTSDHGQVDVRDAVFPVHPAVRRCAELLSGEGRFRWLHARPGMAERLAEAARAHHGDVAWVRTREEAEAEGWFGGRLSAAAAARLGDVVLAPFEPVAFDDPADTGEIKLVSRHGSLTPAEMWVPLLGAAG
jgi:hypothetical protein